MEKQSDNWLIVGRFGRVHGIKGHITIISFTEPRDNLLGYDELYAFIHNQWSLLTFDTLEVVGKHILAKVKGFSEREAVAAFTNIDIAIKKTQLSCLPAGEFYWHELVGMTVVNQQGQCLGKVTDLISTGANDVLVVEGERKRLIPYVKEQFVLLVDKSKQLITVDWDLDF